MTVTKQINERHYSNTDNNDVNMSDLAIMQIYVSWQVPKAAASQKNNI